MKLFVGAAVSILLLGSCGVTREMQGTIVKDCTGTYIRHNNIDFKICNESEIGSAYVDQRITINYKEVNDCKNASTCPIYHPSAKNIKVKKILN